MSRTLVVLTAVFSLVGFGVGFGLARANRVEPVRRESTESSSDATRERSAQLDRSSHRETSGTSTDLSSAISALASARVSQDANAKLTATMNGRVVDLDGEPMSSLVVRARCVTTELPGAPERPTSYDRPPEAVLLHYAKLFHYRRDHTREATTDENGSFRIDELSNDLVYTAVTPGEDLRLLLDASRRPLRRSEPKSDLEFVAVPMGHVEIEIPALEDMEESDWVQLQLTPTSAADPDVDLSDRSLANVMGSMSHRWRPKSRRASGPAGLCQITPSHDSNIVMPEPVFVELVAGQTTFVSIPVERKFRVSGRLLMAGLPASSGRVVLLPGRHTIEDSAQLEQVRRELSRDDDKLEIPDSWTSNGSYSVDARAGVHTLVYGRSYNQIDGSEEIELDQDLTLDLELPDDTANSVVIDVSGPNGPISNPRFEVQGWSEYSSFSRGGSSPQAIEPGRYRLFPLQGHDNDEREWSLQISVSAPGLGKRAISVVPGESYEVVFTEPASIRVDLAGIESCRFRAGLDVRLQPVVESDSDETRNRRSYYRQEKKFDLENKTSVEISPVAPGTYELQLVNKKLSEWGELVLETQTIEVREGEQNRTLRVPPLHKIEFVAAEGDNHGILSPVSSTDEPLSSRQISMQPSGSLFTLKGVPSGRYQVQIWGQNHRMKIIDVRGDEKFELVKENFAELIVSVQDPNGAISLAGFEDKDRIVGVAGALFADADSMKAEFARWLTLSSVDVTVRRKDVDLAITVDPRIFFAADAGGRVYPRRN